jgi:hypothetical protein
MFGDATIEFAIDFLDLLSNCRLVKFYVGTIVPATKLTTRRLYAALSSHLNHFALEILYVGLPERDYSEMEMPPVLASYFIIGHILATLFCFGNLTEITLAPPVGFDIDDGTVADMARARPKLKSLSLMASSDPCIIPPACRCMASDLSPNTAPS